MTNHREGNASEQHLDCSLIMGTPPGMPGDDRPLLGELEGPGFSLALVLQGLL
jgi:hypothetical protein